MASYCKNISCLGLRKGIPKEATLLCFKNFAIINDKETRTTSVASLFYLYFEEVFGTILRQRRI